MTSTSISGTERPPAPIRAVIVEDHRLVAEAIADMVSLESDLDVLGLAESGSDAVDLVLRTRPDIVLMDIGLVGLNGIEATRQIKAARPDAKILILSMHDDDESVAQAVAAGAAGFMPKNADRLTLLRAVRAVADGEGFLHERVTRRLFDRIAPLIDEALLGGRLSPKESLVLQELASGHATKEIAKRLVLAEETVKSHLAHIYQKLGARDRTHAVAIAIRRGLVP
jgi:DNA-binding NarL/FixJ family response regulator